MRSSSGPGIPALLPPLFLLALALLAAGCSGSEESVAIAPAPASTDTELSLGLGARVLSFGPGDKGSPRVSPSGERIAFVLDGYAAEKPLNSRQFHRRTGEAFGAESVEWLLDGSLAVLSGTEESGSQGASPPGGSLSAALSGEASDVYGLFDGVGAVGAIPGSQAVIVAAGAAEDPARSELLLLWGPGESESVPLEGRVGGRVTSLSVSPDGNGAALAVRREDGRFEVRTYQFSEGTSRRVARAAEGMEVLGAPQWTPHGVYFVVGKASEAAGEGEPSSNALYRVPEESAYSGSPGEPEKVSGVGEEFVPASISASPDGERLAVVGRRNPGSATNLYVLHSKSDTLEAATNNENMEVKTNPRDLTWSPGGRSVVIVARGALSGPEVYDASKEEISSAFYNLYEVPVGPPEGEGGP